MRWPRNRPTPARPCPAMLPGLDPAERTRRALVGHGVGAEAQLARQLVGRLRPVAGIAVPPVARVAAGLAGEVQLLEDLGPQGEEVRAVALARPVQADVDHPLDPP